MDKNIIDKILAELYQEDASLKKYENEIRELVEYLIKSKPDIKYNQNFKSQLRAELLEKFDTIKNKNNKAIFNFNNMKNLAYTFGTLALVLLVVVPSLMLQTKTSSNRLAIDMGLEIVPGQREAFGSLVASQGNLDNPAQAVGLGGGGGGNATIEGKMVADTMIYPYYVYEYTYEGEEFSIDGDQMNVYKRLKGLNAQNQLASLIQNVNFEGLDIKSFKNSQLKNFQISEDRDFGYSLYMDLYEGTMSIYENWEKWPQTTVYEPLDITQVPDDATLIAVADKFLSDKKIDTSLYGPAQVDNQWKETYLREGLQQDYVPEVISVVYPLQIEGDKTVYEEWGGYYGIRVSVNIRHKKVANAWGMSTQKYQSSVYEMEQDIDKILKLASQGGSYYPIYRDANAQVVNIALDTPHLAYTLVWNYDGNQSAQLYVPALVFPIKELPNDGNYFYKENVVIPLAKEIVDARLNPDLPDGPRPMPLLEQ